MMVTYIKRFNYSIEGWLLIMHFIVLNRLFEQEVIKKHPHVTAGEVWSKFNDQFPKWFEKHVSYVNTCRSLQ